MNSVKKEVDILEYFVVKRIENLLDKGSSYSFKLCSTGKRATFKNLIKIFKIGNDENLIQYFSNNTIEECMKHYNFQCSEEYLRLQAIRAITSVRIQDKLEELK